MNVNPLHSWDFTCKNTHHGDRVAKSTVHTVGPHWRTISRHKKTRCLLNRRSNEQGPSVQALTSRRPNECDTSLLKEQRHILPTRFSTNTTKNPTITRERGWSALVGWVAVGVGVGETLFSDEFMKRAKQMTIKTSVATARLDGRLG